MRDKLSLAFAQWEHVASLDGPSAISLDVSDAFGANTYIRPFGFTL